MWRDRIDYLEGQFFVICFKNFLEGKVVINDYVCGKIEISNIELDDFIIQCFDGIFIYNFCVVVDDWDMGIIYVVCGEDYINNMLC